MSLRRERDQAALIEDISKGLAPRFRSGEYLRFNRDGVVYRLLINAGKLLAIPEEAPGGRHDVVTVYSHGFVRAAGRIWRVVMHQDLTTLVFLDEGEDEHDRH